MAGYVRKFSGFDADGKEIKLAIVEPTKIVLNEADLKYAATVSKAIREGVMTMAECRAFVAEHNKFTKEDAQKIEEKRNEIAKNEAKLANCENKENGVAIAKKIQELRREIMVINERVNSFIRNSAEALAENIRDDYITSQCTVYEETGKKYFSDYNDYLDKAATLSACYAKTNVVGYINGIEENFIMNLPENKYLVQNGVIDKNGVEIDNETGMKKDPVTGNFLNDNGEFIDKDGNLVDEFGNKLESLEKAEKDVATKRGRKKKEIS